MRPNFHPSLVNGRWGDPALFVELLHRSDALLFDCGELPALSNRDVLRISHVFISHMHIDHFIGFDRLLRLNVGREKDIMVVGPAGIARKVHHKLQSYEWDLVDRYDTDLVFDVVELAEGQALRSRFRFKRAFALESSRPVPIDDGLVVETPAFTVRAAILEHHGPCLGFSLSEPAHVNVWKNRLDERGLAPGPWLQSLKQAVLQGAGDDHCITMPDGHKTRLAQLRDLVSVTRGQKLAYVTDVADSPANRARITRLAYEADLLFIESRFAAADADQAAARAHLTTKAAGAIARAAQVRRVEPFHFSPRYEGEEERMLGEVQAAYAGASSGG